MKALIVDDVAVNVVPNDMLAQSFHPDVAERFEDVPSHVKVGYRRGEDGKWTAPPIPSDIDGPASPQTPE